MDLDQLRALTRQEHEATESMLPLMDAGLTREAYQAALRKLFAILRGWELWAETHAPDRFRPLLQDRQRSPLLLQDLRFLQHSAPPEALPASAFAELFTGELTADNLTTEDASPAARREARFAGALYVVEGSTLGGQYIARHVEEVFGFRPGEGDAYFRGYGEQTGSAWREVKAAIGALPDRMLGDVVGGAKEMFGIFARGLA